MICMKIQAGFGNQLFQYAMGYALSKKTGQPLMLDISFNRYYQMRRKLRLNSPEMFRCCYLEKLNLEKCVFAGNPFKHWEQFIRRKIGIKTIHIAGSRLPMRFEDFNRCREYQSEVVENIPCEGAYFEGFWQNYSYFDCVKNELRDMFTPNYRFNSSTLTIMKQIKSCNSVGVHIRRGDFIKLGWDQGIDFYLKGIQMLHEKTGDCRFFVFTDDKPWAKEKLKEINDLQVVEIESDLKDLDEFFLLKECKHHIISESTFGWWAAYLNDNTDRIVVVPNKAVGDLFKNDWIKL